MKLKIKDITNLNLISNLLLNLYIEFFINYNFY